MDKQMSLLGRWIVRLMSAAGHAKIGTFESAVETPSRDSEDDAISEPHFSKLEDRDQVQVARRSALLEQILSLTVTVWCQRAWRVAIMIMMAVEQCCNCMLCQWASGW